MKKYLKIDSVIILIIVFTTLLGCKKINTNEENRYNEEIFEKFFSNTANLPKVEQRLVNLLKLEENKFHFIENFVKFQGIPLWKSATISINQTSTNFTNINNIGNSDTILKIPLQLQGYQTVHGYFLCIISADSIGIAVIDGRTYEQYEFLNNSTQPVVAENLATEIMEFNHTIFGLNNFTITDNRLFGNSQNNNLKKIAKFENNSNNGNLNNIAGCAGVSSTIFITTTTINNHCPYPTNQCPNINTGILGPCDNCTQSCTTTTSNTEVHSFCTPNAPNNPNVLIWTLEGNGVLVGGLPNNNPPPPPSWYPTPSNPCSTSTIGNSTTTICGIGWNLDLTDEHGYYYSRMASLDSLLNLNPFSLLPCDSLTLMDFTTYDSMYQNVSQFKPSLYVKNRIDSIRLVASNWIVNNFYLTNVETAHGNVVNCDFFPVRITTMPTGFTPQTLLEFFRKNINIFIDPSLGVNFSAYNDLGSFNDTTRYNSTDTNSIGALVHIHMDNDGSVILSNYYHNLNTQSHKFTFTTMATPLDYSHPVAGNRVFGIYKSTSTTSPNDFVFYTMGVDRTNDWVMSSGNSVFDGFGQADKLWKSIQKNMINFINNPILGGHAEYYSRPQIIARPKWQLVKEYLLGNVDLASLKVSLGC
jgi:hypothetical protein